MQLSGQIRGRGNDRRMVESSGKVEGDHPSNIYIPIFIYDVLPLSNKEISAQLPLEDLSTRRP